MLFGKHDGTGSGIDTTNTDFFQQHGVWVAAEPLGQKSGTARFSTATWAALAAVFLTQRHQRVHCQCRGHCVQVQQGRHSSTRTETRKQNTNTECRIQQVAGVYVEGGGGNNGKIYSYNYGTVASGSLGFNADGIATNDKFCCYIAQATARAGQTSKTSSCC